MAAGGFPPHPPALPIPANAPAPDGVQYVLGDALAAISARVGLAEHTGPAWEPPPDGPVLDDRDMRVGDRTAPLSKRLAVFPLDAPDPDAPRRVRVRPSATAAAAAAGGGGVGARANSASRGGSVPPRPPSAPPKRVRPRPPPEAIPDFTLRHVVALLRRGAVGEAPPQGVGGYAGRKAAKAAAARARATLPAGGRGRPRRRTRRGGPNPPRGGCRAGGGHGGARRARERERRERDCVPVCVCFVFVWVKATPLMGIVQSTTTPTETGNGEREGRKRRGRRFTLNLRFFVPSRRSPRPAPSPYPIPWRVPSLITLRHLPREGRARLKNTAAARSFFPIRARMAAPPTTAPPLDALPDDKARFELVRLREREEVCVCVSHARSLS